MTELREAKRKKTISVGLIVLGTFGFGMVSSEAWAQRRSQDPHLAYAFPAGCQRGSTSEVFIGGQYLQNADEAYVALGPDDTQDVHVEIVDWYRPMTRGEYQTLRRKMLEAKVRLTADRIVKGRTSTPTEQEIIEYLGITPQTLREMQIYRERDRDPRRQPNDQLDELVRIRVKVDSNATVGKRELRLLTDSAMSNPLWLHIGQWVEVQESEPNDRFPCEVVDAMPVVVNGQIMPGDIDRISFKAKAGMRLVARVDAREVIPYLADAVPGWFQAMMRLLDREGNEIQVADAFYFRQDPMMFFEVPTDGMYTIEIRDSIYRGREDFVYRLTLGEIPIVTSVFPLGAQVGSTAELKLHGWNLSQSNITIDTMDRSNYRPMLRCRSEQNGGIPVDFSLKIDYWPEVFDLEPNNTPSNAQHLKAPMTVNGRINFEGDVDVYRIKGGGRMVAEIEARSLGSPLDSILRLTDEAGNTIAENDDFEDLTQSLLTHHADSHLTATLGGNGDHFLFVGDAQDSGGIDFAYRLQIRRPAPDYDLRVTPSNLIVRPGQTVPITAFAVRRDGFTQDIQLSLVDAPEGFQLSGNVIPGDASSAMMTLTIPRKFHSEENSNSASNGRLRLKMNGQTLSRGRRQGRLMREAIPAENMMQAFIWHHLVPVEHWNVLVSKKAASKLPFTVAPIAESTVEPRLRIVKAGYTYIEINPASKSFQGDRHFIELNAPPSGVTASVVTTTSGPAIKLVSDDSKTQAGQRGNLLMSVYKEVTPAPTEENPAPTPRRIDYGYLPALPYQIGR